MFISQRKSIEIKILVKNEAQVVHFMRNFNVQVCVAGGGEVRVAGMSESEVQELFIRGRDKLFYMPGLCSFC